MSTSSTMRLALLRSTAIIVLATSFACSDPAEPGVRSLDISAPEDSLLLGRTMQLTTSFSGDSATAAASPTLWTSSDTGVVVVDDAGLVLAVGTGEAMVVADLAGKRDSVQVRVVLLDLLPNERFTLLSYGIDGVCAAATSGTVFCAPRAAAGVMPVFAPLTGSTGMAFMSLHTTTYSMCGHGVDSLMRCWGRNAQWHFGNGMPSSFRADDAPALGAGGRKFAVLTAAGDTQSCGINAADSVVYCFGENAYGQLGRGTRPADDSVPAPVSGALKARAVSTGHFFTCALDLAGALHCWGSNFISGLPDIPTRLDAPDAFERVSAGWQHACALTAAGEAYCVGINGSGQIGGGTVGDNAILPTRVLADVPFISVSAFVRSSCGISQDQRLFCWGSFMPVSLSDRLGARVASPVPLARTMRFKAVAGSPFFACGITDTGRLLCW